MKKATYHIKVRQLQSGYKTWECDVTSDELTLKETLAQSSQLVTNLEQLYPAPPKQENK